MATPPARIKGYPGLDATSNQIISPLDIATNGLLSVLPSRQILSPSLTIASMGWIVFLEEEIVEVVVEGGGKPQRPKKRGVDKRKKYRKKITCRVRVDGEWYTDVAYTEDLKLNLKTVQVKMDLNEQKKPIIEIILPEVKHGRD